MLPKEQALLAASGAQPVKSSKEVLYRCPKHKSVLATSGLLRTQQRRCTWCARRNRITPVHAHKYDCAPEHDSMVIQEENAKSKANDDRSEVFSARILRAQTVGFARLGVSISKMASPAARQMTRDLVQVGIDLQSRSQGAHLVADEYVHGYSRPTYQEELLASYERERNYLLNQYGSVRFVNLKIDAGTVCKSHCTHCILDSPEAKLPPWIYEVQVNDGWTTEQYREYLCGLFDYLESHEPSLVITSIVHDNLPAQSNAVAAVLEGRKLRVIDVPCVNHMLNLVFSGSVAENSKLARGVDMALAYQKVLRMEKINLPLVPKTRWLYVVELIDLIEQYRDRVEVFCALNEGVDMEIFGYPIAVVHQQLDYVQAVLKPLQDMSMMVERRAATLSEVIKWVFSSIKQWRDAANRILNHNEDALSMLDSVVSHLFARLRSNAFEECITAFVLSINGRQWLSENAGPGKQLRDFQLPNDGLLGTTDRIEVSQETEAVQEVQPVIQLDPEDQLELSNMEEEDSSESSVTQRRRAVFTQWLQEMRGIPLIQKLTPEFIGDYMEITAETIYKFTHEKDSNDQIAKSDAIQQIQALVTAWLSNQWGEFLRTVSSTYGLSDRICLDVRFWEQVCCLVMHHGAPEVWGPFAEIACIFQNAACSEAAVERLLSVQRHLQGSTMTNVGMPVLTAKLQMYGPDVMLPADVHDVIPQ